MDYKIVYRDIELEQKPNQNVTSYYQICTYRTPDGLHPVRKYKISGDGDVLDVRDRYFSKSDVRKFVRYNKRANYRTYPVGSVSDLPQVTGDDIRIAHSDLTGKN